MHRLVFASLLTILASCPSAFSKALPATSSTVDLGYAQYQANLEEQTGVTHFLGVRYAADAGGANRFRAPQSPPTLQGVQDGSVVPPACIQSSIGGPPPPTTPQNGIEKRRVVPAPSEDCLFLNVHIPGSVDASKRLPVVVWFHGGGYVLGNATLYNGGQLVQDSDHQVIAVVVQYRLGLFGFLAGSEVKANGSPNAALFDQEFALKWIQEHISKFGGDKDRVTIWGQSAGAGSVLQHIVARNGQTSPPLFQQATLSSPSLYPQYNYDHAIPEAIYGEVVEKSGCAGASDRLGCLRSVDLSILKAVNVDVGTPELVGAFVFVPVIDGELVMQSLIQALREGSTNGAALLAIVTANEGEISINKNNTLTTLEYVQRLLPLLTEAQAAAVVGQYEHVEERLAKQALIYAEFHYVCPSIWAADSYSAQNKVAYKAEFALPPAVHTQDVLYYFNGLVVHPAAATLPVLNHNNFRLNFAQAFLSFVISQDPNVKIDSTSALPTWPLSDENALEMRFGVNGNGQPEMEAVEIDEGLVGRCQFWDGMKGFTH